MTVCRLVSIPIIDKRRLGRLHEMSTSYGVPLWFFKERIMTAMSPKNFLVLLFSISAVMKSYTTEDLANIFVVFFFASCCVFR
ncbi:hypothetical protein EYC80_004371 [Monilinia laxa]|uniref:Uncharacterized protein n=1 Tax=Monilinia laxa TaxID=61186 RepID=A0A5N6KMK8_MONLA|nr:hypothetical protein EYC80_004371 [Monilinia laxa]